MIVKLPSQATSEIKPEKITPLFEVDPYWSPYQDRFIRHPLVEYRNSVTCTIRFTKTFRKYFKKL